MKKIHNLFTSRSLISTVVISFTIAGCQQTSIENQSATLSETSISSLRTSGEKDFVDGELLIQFKEGVLAAAKQRAFDKVKGQPVEKILTKAMERVGKKEGLTLVKVNKNVLEAVAELNGAEGVDFAEPNYVYYHTAVSTDTYFTKGSLWGMYGPSTSPASRYGSNAAAAWATGNTGATSVYVGVIDTGIQLTHPDLAGQVWINPVDPTDGVDNDGNGFVDDTNGWDFVNNDASIYDGGTNGSLDDHGTHVSGTIGGKANGKGVVGVNWNIKLISAKFLGRNIYGTTANAVKAVDYLTNLKNRGINIVASNNSWGGGDYSQALYEAIARANDAGIMFIASAGNSGTNNDVTPYYPSSYDLPNVIAVAAIDKNGALASFSQYGATTVDLGAPGVAINSTTAYNTYSSYDGTSMATPYVTGAVALYASTHPGASITQIRNAILSSAVPTASLAGKTVTGGRLDVNGALGK